MGLPWVGFCDDFGVGNGAQVRPICDLSRAVGAGGRILGDRKGSALCPRNTKALLKAYLG